jgi:type I restriction enzyme S subunit
MAIENNITSLRGTKQSVSLIPKLRFKEFEGDWEKKFYGDIYSFYSTNSLSRDKLNYESGKVKNVHYGDIHTKFSTVFNIKNELVPFINEDINLDKIKEENYCQEGDLLIADASEDYNDIGKTIEIINLNNEKVLAGLHTFLARPNKRKMQKGFSGYLLQSWNIRKQVMTIAQGTKVLSLATGRLSKVKLNLPNLPEQQKIATFLTSVDTKIQQL